LCCVVLCCAGVLCVFEGCSIHLTCSARLSQSDGFRHSETANVFCSLTPAVTRINPATLHRSLPHLTAHHTQQKTYNRKSHSNNCDELGLDLGFGFGLQAVYGLGKWISGELCAAGLERDVLVVLTHIDVVEQCVANGLQRCPLSLCFIHIALFGAMF
jgi:hypothetical protein